MGAINPAFRRPIFVLEGAAERADQAKAKGDSLGPGMPRPLPPRAQVRGAT